MAIKTIATFFDGESSTPQKIGVSFEEYTGFFYFDVAVNESKNWSIDDVSIDQSGSFLQLKIGHSPIRYFKIDDPIFIESVNDYRRKKGTIGWYQNLINLGLSVHITIGIVFLALIGLAYVYLVPWVGEKAATLLPVEYDNTIGANVHENFCKLNTVDSAKTYQLNLFTQKLNLKNNKKLNFTVIESSTVNAFALPDGNVVVFTGIIDKMESYEELVALLGHEATHINNRHSMKMMCRNMAGYLLISALLSDVNGIMAIIGDNVHNLQSLSFSRQFEQEADEDGLAIMLDNRVNPEGMVQLFKRLQSDVESYVPAFLSSHPITKDRMNYIEQHIQSNRYQTIENTELKEIFEKIKYKDE